MRPSPMQHQGGGTGCAPYVVSGGGQLFSSHACWDASCSKTITSPSCYYTQLGKKMHPIWPLLPSIRYKYKIQHDLIFHLVLAQPTKRGSAPGSPHPQRSEKHIWCGYCWGWSPVVEVNEKSDVLSADCMICFQVDLHWSVKCYTEMPEERIGLFIGLFLVPLKLPLSLLSALIWSTPFLGDRQSRCSSA